MAGRSVLFLNLLILTGIVISAQQLISGWRSFQEEEDVAQMMASVLSQSVSTETGLEDMEDAEYLDHDFFVISERDLFRPERRPELEGSEEEAAETVAEFPKRPEMNGVTVRNEERVALVTVYDSPKAQGVIREVRLGQDLQGYTVTEITDTSVTLTWKDQQEVIDIADTELAGGPKARVRTVAALNIIRIGSKVAAVETTAVSSPEEEGKGLQVGVVGGQAAGSRTGGRSALTGRTGMSGQRGLTGSRGRGTTGLNPNQSRGLPGTLGLGGAGRQATQTRLPQ